MRPTLPPCPAYLLITPTVSCALASNPRPGAFPGWREHCGWPGGRWVPGRTGRWHRGGMQPRCVTFPRLLACCVGPTAFLGALLRLLSSLQRAWMWLPPSHRSPPSHPTTTGAHSTRCVCVCAVCVGWRGVGWDGVGVGVGRSGAAEVIWLCSPPYDDAPASALRGPINVRLRTSTCATLCLLDVFTLCLRGLRHPLPAWHVAECCLHATRHPLPPAQLTPSSASTTTCATPASCPLPSVQFAGCVGRAFCALC